LTRGKGAEIKKGKKTKDMTDGKILELIQSLCKHRRRQFVFEEGRNITRCLDCGKRLKKPIKT